MHVKNEYDYMFESENRNDIFESVKYAFWKMKGYNMPIYGVNDKLQDYATTKKDINNGYEIEPKEEHRMKSEDKYPENEQAASNAKSYNMKQDQGQQSAAEIDQWNNEVQNSVAQPIYSRSGNESANVTL